MLSLYALLCAILFKALTIYLRHGKAKGKAKQASALLFRDVPNVVLRTGSTAKGPARRVVVTGGRGYLGRHVVESLLEELGDAVHVVVFDLYGEPGDDPRVTYIQGDLRTATHIRKLLEGVDILVHVAGVVAMATTTRSQLMHVNFECTRELVEACLELDVKGFVYTSSLSAMVPLGKAPLQLVTETSPHPAEASCVYGESKRRAERLVLAAPCHCLRTIVLRPGGIYGHGDTIMVDEILKSAVYMGEGKQSVPVVWVRDAARAHMLAVKALLEKPTQANRGVTGRAYHLCHDPVADPFSYRFFGGGQVVPRGAATAEPNPWVGQPYSKSLPMWLVRSLCAVNEFTVRWLGWACISQSLFTANVDMATLDSTWDISGSRALLGWEPTPFREAAKRVMAEVTAAAEKEKETVKEELKLLQKGRGSAAVAGKKRN